MIRVYHGSNEAIEKPLVNIGRPYLDFGTGFYVTNMITQAKIWAGIKARLFGQPEGTLSLYDFDLDAAKAEYRSISLSTTTASGCISSLVAVAVAMSGASGTLSRVVWPTTV